MANLTRNNWSGGWNPSIDPINGNKNELVKLVNLTLDKDGALTLTKGTRIVSGPYPGYITNIFSRFHNGRKIRYISIDSGIVYRLDPWNVIAGGDYSFELLRTGGPQVCFANAWGEVFICGPNKCFWKDDSILLRNIGLPKPNGEPIVVRHEQQELPVAETYGSWTLEEGENQETTNPITSSSADYLKADSAADTNRICFKIKDISFDATAFSSGPSESIAKDTFSFKLRLSDSNYFDFIRVEFWLDDPETGGDYYYKQWENDDYDNINQGLLQWSNPSCTRGDFSRAGTNTDKNWSGVKAIRVIIQGTAAITGVVTELKFVGSEMGNLTGVYQYTSILVYRGSKYISKSVMGDKATPQVITNGYFDITTYGQPWYSNKDVELWIYRRSYYSEEYKDFKLGALDQWYRVLVFTQEEFGTTKKDDVSDDDAIAEGMTLNNYLLSMQDLPEDVFCMLMPVFDRALYMTLYSIYISDSLNPDSIDTRYTINISGAIGEKNLFVVKLTEGVILLATTRDFYLITGDFTPLPDGTLNVSVKGIGEAHPPISKNFTMDNGNIIYMAADGWRSTRGAYSTLLSARLNALFNDQVVASGWRPGDIFPVYIIPDDGGTYPCCIGQGKLFVSMPLTDGRRYTFVYDLVKEYWYLYETDPIFLYTEEDGTILSGYGWGDGTYLRELYVGTKLDYDSPTAAGQHVIFRTIFDDDDKPRNRKESYTLKLTMDTGNKPVSVYMSKDDHNFLWLGTYSFDGVEEKIIDIAETVGIAFRFGLQIAGVDLEVCRIINFTVEYGLYPEQLTALRIPYDNLGTASRKRIVNYPIVIDCLGNSTVLTPYLDGTAKTPSTITLARKGTHVHYFTDDTIGTDIGGYLAGGPFEFYGLNSSEIVSEKLPVPVKFLVIPNDDYGVPNRKRHSSYKFQIDTRGFQVRFTPILDNVAKTPLDFSTTAKQTVPYYFSVDTVGIDIGGTLESLDDEEFEFYGPIRPQKIEILPDMLKEFRIPENNFGVAAPKRIRTIPLVINTCGHDVTFTPIVDGVSKTPTVLNTATRATTYHYFDYDSFGTDYSGELIGNYYFEFYDMLKPEQVEILPVAKKFDQIGPFRFDSIARLLAVRIRLIASYQADAIPVKVLCETEQTSPNTDSAVGKYNYSLIALGGIDNVYENQMPKSILGTVFRFELGPSYWPFYRYDLQIKVNICGKNQTTGWISSNAGYQKSE
jgi:hypothetical protein